MRKLYAAYGTFLADGVRNVMCREVKVVAKSWLHDYRLVFQGAAWNGFPNVIPAEGNAVPLAVFEITEADEKKMDFLFGLYTKQRMTIEVAGEMKEVIIHTLPPMPYGFPKKGTVNSIREGYREFNFPQNVLNKAVTEAYEKAPRLQSLT